jgi:hypothetical protein
MRKRSEHPLHSSVCSDDELTLPPGNGKAEFRQKNAAMEHK